MNTQKIVILGPPGAGKTTQGTELALRLNLQYTGYRECLVHHLTKKTSLGEEFRPFYLQKKAVPGELMNRMLRELLLDKNKGFIIEGYPITESQTIEFIEEFSPDLCVFIRIPENVSRERLNYRRVDPETRDIYNLLSDPPPEYIGGRLRRMKSDSPVNINKRLKTYYEDSDFENVIVKKYFKDQTVEVDGTQKKEELFEEILQKVILHKKTPNDQEKPSPEEEKKEEENPPPILTKEEKLKRVEEITKEFDDLKMNEQGDKDEEYKEKVHKLYLERTDLYCQLKEYQKAQEDCNEIMSKIDPRHIAANLITAGIFIEKKEFEDALKQCEVTIECVEMKKDELTPEEYGVHMGRVLCMKASVFRESGDIPKFEEILKIAAEKNADVVLEGLHHYYESKMEEEKFEECLEIVKTGLEISETTPPTDMDWCGIHLRNQGIAYTQLNQYEKALQFFEKVRAYPNIVNEILYYWISSCFRGLKKYKDVVTSTTKVIDGKRSTGNKEIIPIVYLFRGEAWIVLGDQAKGIRDLHKSMEIISGLYPEGEDSEEKVKKHAIYNTIQESLGIAYFKLRMFHNSYVHIMNCVENKHEAETVYYLLGILQERHMKRYEDALSSFGKCLEINPNHVDARRGKGMLHFNLKQWKNSKMEYSYLIEKFKIVFGGNEEELNDNARKVFLLDSFSRALCCFHLGENQQAIDDYNLIEKLSQELKEEEEETKEGEEEVENALKRITRKNILNEEFYRRRIQCYKRLERFEKALEEVDKCIQSFPGAEPSLSLEKARIYFLMENYDLAIENYQKFMESIPEPQHFAVLNDIGYSYRKKGENQKALEVYNKSIENNSIFNDGGYRGRGMTYVMLKEYKKGLEDFSKSIELLNSDNYRLLMMMKPNSHDEKIVNMSSALNSKGYIYSVLGEYEKALEFFNQALKIRPVFANPYNHRGYVYLLTGELKKAMNDFEKALEINPRYNQAIQRKVRCMAEMEERERIRFLIKTVLPFKKEKKMLVMKQQDDEKIYFFQWNCF